VTAMGRFASTFRQTDLTRAVRAVEAAGMKVTRVEIDPDGRIILQSGGAPAVPSSELDGWLEKNNARSA
jgi:hypothetical protein